MPKQLNVNLAFTADTGTARSQLQELQNSLTRLVNTSTKQSTGLGLTKELNDATTAAAELKVHLDQAVNVNTGNLDFSKLSESLKRSGKTLSEYGEQLQKLGPDGQKAFQQLAQSITNAEIPIKRSNAAVQELWTSLKNTARWQMSSSMLHGFMGAIQSAYGYAKNLNESLNEIRIVTGHNIDYMDKFAEKANKAAKALSATTLDYTNASLIYYQQGLSDQEVADRTAVTLKMANVANESATTISDQLTSVWNNFYDGSESLEHYADAMVRLGADTASSSSEISEGLQKFSSVAGTIGLSFDNAAAALATITATTRESADVVGTALKTLFSRIQGLNLGKTLDDGTDLNKYSTALHKVGIEIKDTDGQLKDMDVILDEMGSKWNTWGRDTQTALAQTVAGVRQYTQLMTLMNNYDFYKENVERAKNADGSLQEQADIYAESWEAARDRVRAAWEAIYKDLVNDKAFISILNGFEKVLSGVDLLIKSLGGLKGTIFTIGAIATKVFHNQIAQSLTDLSYNLKSMTQAGRDSIKNERVSNIKDLVSKIPKSTEYSTEEETAQTDALEKELLLQTELIENSERMSESELKTNQILLDRVKILSQQKIVAAKKRDEASNKIDEASFQGRVDVIKAVRNENGFDKDNSQEIDKLSKKYSHLTKLLKEKIEIQVNVDKSKKALLELSDSVEDIGKKRQILTDLTKNLDPNDSLRKLIDNLSDADLQGDKFADTLAEIQGSLQQRQGHIGELLMNLGVLPETVNKLSEGYKAGAEASDQFAQSTKELDAAHQQASDSINHSKGVQKDWADNLVTVANSITAVISIINTLKGVVDTITSPDTTPWEKFSAVLMGLATIIPMVTMAFNKESLAALAATSANIAAAVGLGTEATAAMGAAAATGAFSASLWTLLWPLGLVVAAIGAVIGVCYLLVKGIEAIDNAYNKDSVAAEKAAETAQKLADAYSEVKTEYQEMISAMENYQSALDGLNDLTKGTQEYNEALKEANKQALDLITAYNLLEGQDYNWDDGKLVINNNSLNQLKSAKAKEVDQAYGASQMAQSRYRDKQAQADKTQLQRDIRTEAGYSDTKETLYQVGTLIIAGLGAAISAGTSGLFTPVATGMTLIANHITEQFSAKSDEFDKAINRTIDKAKTNPEIFANVDALKKGINLDDDEIINALMANKDAILEQVSQEKANEAGRKAAAQNTANEIMMDTGFDNNKAGQMALQAGGNIYSNLEEKAFEFYNSQKLTKNSDLLNQYVKDKGLDSLNGYKLESVKGDIFKYSYIDENNERQTKEVTKAEITSTLAAVDAADQLKEALSGLRDKITDLNNSNDNKDHAFADFLSTGNLENSTWVEFDQLKQSVGTGEDREQNINSILGLTGDAEADLALAQSYGYETAEAYKQAFKSALEVDWQLPDIGLDNSILSTLTMGTSKQIQDTYNSMGEAGGQAFVNALNTVSKSIDWESMSPDEIESAWSQISNVDWSSWEAGDKVAAIVKDLGGNLDTTSESWKANIEAMREANHATPDFTTLKENISAINKIVKDLDLGDILSKEDYDTLVAYNSELSKYFAILSDGSAQFVGDPLDFAQQVKEDNREKLQEAIEANKKNLLYLENQYNKGINALNGDVNNLQGYRASQNYINDVGENKYYGSDVQTQLDFLSSQGYDQNQIALWQNDLSDGSTTVQVLGEIADAVNNVGDSFTNIPDKVKASQTAIQQAMNEIALSAEDTNERLELLNDGSINVEAYNYAALAAHNADKWDGLDPTEVETYAKGLAKAAANSEILSDELINNKEAAEDVALYTKRMNKGIDSLADGFKNWSSILTKSTNSSEEYITAMDEIKDAMSDVLGVSKEFISDDFIIKHLSDIELAAKGDADAIDRLALAAARDILINISLNDKELQQQLLALNDNLINLIPTDIKVGATLDTEEFQVAAQGIVDAASMTVEQAQAYFNSLGYEPEFVMQNETRTAPMYGKRVYTDDPVIGSVPDGNGGEYQYVKSMLTHEEQEYMGEHEQNFVVPAMSANGTPKIKSITKTSSGSMNNYSSSNSGGKSPGKSSGGGGSKSKASKKDLTKKSDVVDRYKEIDDSIHDLTRSLDKGNKAADRMWGKSRISAMKANNKMLQDEIGLLNKKAEEAKKYLALDKQELLLAAKKAGVNFQFDEDGDISNYTQEMTRLYDELHAAEEHINSLKTKEAQDEYEESVLKAIEDKIAELKSALSQYEETKSLIEDLEDQAEEKFYEWQDNNFEILNHELEVKITLDDNELKKLDYFFNKLSDNIYKAAEALGYLQGQIDPTFGKMKSYEDYYNSLESSYANGEISQAAYVEGLQDAYDSIIDNLEAVQDLDKQMLEYYGNTLDLAEEELSKYTDQMEHLTSVLDHYRSILSLLGRDTDYTRVLTVLEGNAQTKRNKFDTSKAWYESLKAERDAAAAALAQASDDAERELLQKNYDAIVAKFNEAEEQMLSDAEAYGEAIKEVLTTKMEQAAENMNKAMTDGMGWDALNDSLDRLSKYQDEYLTKTNQIYEMNKLLNDVNKASNKTNNQAAKDKYYQFSKEIEQLKEKDKLSQLELDIAQAKYKVLQAQIALDEAQNAMGKVRLQRDNEGNFGYVYTADQDKIDDAQQALADAENDLYNIRLDATNKYGQQKLQYEQELAEKLKEIDEKANEDALYREGNYQADRQRIIDEYTQLIQASSDLYRIAQEEDSRVVQDAWVNAYDEIIDSGDQWKTAIIDYTGQINNAFQEWQAETDRLTDLVGKDLVDTKNKVNDVTNASDQLKDEVINKVVPALTQELQAVRNATEAYARQRQEIMNLISYYEQLISKIQQAIAAQASMDAGSNSSSSDYDDYDPSVDYSALMGTVPVGSELYNKYKAYRDRKMSEGNYGNVASTARINKFYEMGYKLGEGKFAGYTNFTQIPDWLWEETIGKTFRTGGYTGSWGESGKLAMLHEKELVLNKEDTQNMLSSIKMVREIASEIDLRSRYTTMPINPVYSTFGTGNDILEQQVHIDASFPNVTDRNEIQEAFNTLINVASQYANRK